MDSYIGMYMTRTPSTRSIEDSIIKAQFQQKQMQEKEAKLLQMLDSQQQKALQKAGLNGVLPSNRYSSNMNVVNNNNNNNNNHLLMNGNSTVANVGAGKVRQMFEERRKNGGTLSSSSRNGALTGIDKGHPLEPLVVTGSHSNTSNKSRSSSSKSDPANYPTNGMRNTQVPPMMKPVNLGSNNRATSLNRESSRKSPAPAPTHTSNGNHASTLSSANSTASNGSSGGGGKPYHQRQMNKSSASHPPPPPAQNVEQGIHDYVNPLPTTTKYSDYAQELEKRENALANKLRKTNISSPDAAPDYASSGGGSKSSSPMNRSVTSSPTRPNSKSPTTMSTTPGARSGRPSMSSVRSAGSSQSASSSVRKTVGSSGGIIKSKPTPPPRSSAGPPPGLEECKVCGRYFAPDRIQKHEQICKKTSTKKRKVFDPTKMRMQGTEAEPYIRVVSAKPNKPVAAPTAKKSDWRKKHEEFIATIRAAKEYQAHVAKGGDPKDLPPPPPTDTSDYIQCPYCNRKFSEAAAERHIPKCKNIKSNKR